jgi:hypothetical protein
MSCAAFSTSCLCAKDKTCRAAECCSVLRCYLPCRHCVACHANCEKALAIPWQGATHAHSTLAPAPHIHLCCEILQHAIFADAML